MKTRNRVIRTIVITFLLAAGIALTIFGLTKSYISLAYKEDNSINYKLDSLFYNLNIFWRLVKN